MLSVLMAAALFAVACLTATAVILWLASLTK